MDDRELDDAVEDSFPASDPPAMAEPQDDNPKDESGKDKRGPGQSGPGEPGYSGEVNVGEEGASESSPEGGVQGSPKKDPDEWTTGDEPMTGAQASYLETLSRQAGVEFDRNLTKAEASKRIDELKKQTGRGTKS